MRVCGNDLADELHFGRRHLATAIAEYDFHAVLNHTEKRNATRVSLYQAQSTPIRYLSLPVRRRAVHARLRKGHVASYFWSPTPTGADAVKISSHRLQRNRAHSYTAAEMGAAPVKRTRNLGSASG